MGFGKTFSLSLVAFIGLNFIFSILYLALGPGFDELFNRFDPDSPDYAPLMMIYYLFGSIINAPYMNLNWVITQPLFNDMTDYLILGIGFIVAPLIAAILAGKFAESKLQGFAGWLLTVIISTTVVIVGLFLRSPTFEAELTATYTPYLAIPPPISNEVIMISLIISCVINIVFYGFFALLVAKTEYY
ncbi:MAG: hypothetical protein ACFE8B_00920 [Candidatus Hermodarchaeota archaeon]